MDITQMSMEITNDRKELWGFAVGDRVRIKDGAFGHVTWIGGCSIANTDEDCRDFCLNTIVTDSRGEEHPVPPGWLEHVD